MYCYVYKGERKQDYYLYLARELEADDSSELPKAILALMGELSLVLEFELELNRKLPQAEAAQVMRDIESQGFYLQMPKQDMAALEDQYFN